MRLEPAASCVEHEDAQQADHRKTGKEIEADLEPLFRRGRAESDRAIYPQLSEQELPGAVRIGRDGLRESMGSALSSLHLIVAEKAPEVGEATVVENTTISKRAATMFLLAFLLIVVIVAVALGVTLSDGKEGKSAADDYHKGGTAGIRTLQIIHSNDNESNLQVRRIMYLYYSNAQLLSLAWLVLITLSCIMLTRSRRT